jgi:hypothetical protein
MLIDASERDGCDAVVMWKTDLKAAFTFLKFKASMVRLMSTRLMCSLIFLYYQGNFGWTGMPFAFQVIVRVLLVLVMAVIHGVVEMFVDDMIGVGYTST